MTIEIKFGDEQARGPYNKIETILPGKGVTYTVGANVSLFAKCEERDDGGFVEVSDKSLHISRPGTGYLREDSPYGSAHVHIGREESVDITFRGSLMATVTHVPTQQNPG